MGMFDHVLAECPSCGKEMYEQTKGGECCLNTYRVESQMDIRDAQVVDGLMFRCECGKVWEVKVDQPETVGVRLEEYV